MVSIIVPVYNAARYIEGCVNSIVHQTYSDVEIILVDDGSTDGSGKVCDRLAQDDERIVVIHKENGGAASARNVGLDVAQGEFIAFVDADDYVESSMCEEMIAEMSEPRVSIVCCGITLTDIKGNDKVMASNEKIVLSNEEALCDFFKRKGNIKPSACNKLYRSSLLKNHNLRFNEESFHEDTEIMPYYLDASDKVVVLNKAFYHYVKRENSKTTNRCFSLKGYHFLQSFKECEKMCKMKYPHSLKWFKWYELVTYYEMLLYLVGCIDYKKYILYEIPIRFRIIKSLIQCVKWREIRKEYPEKTKEIFLKSVLGIQLSNFLFS